ncbi:formiminotransferase N-terminal subdomain-containing protein isoform X2 [Hyla sarda]|uniref:formiminotransferase N-terminal subdomain-containing protein isoform X2 n=1 Tax=Hyla sarda TaxID=327740 RepID=UPI0024C23191|nr:formiminotransferase N-terminal subdomain-containing protein isoform X2 [Hyla sarda]
MTSSKFGKSLVACLLNVSEARNKDNIERIARAALFNIRGKSVVSSCVEGFTCIDHSRHEGVHPCLGGIDLVPIYPLSGVTLEQCGEIARGIAEELVTQVPGCSMFLFGYADIAEMRSLADKRRSLGWFRKNCNVDEIKADVGMKPCGKYGITGVGASPYVMNCNITLDTQDLTSGKAIATAIRERTGGLKGVQAMAFPNKGQVEIACNVESFRDIPENISAADVDKYVSYHICGDTFSYISLHHIEAKVQNLAACKGIKTTGTALVGFTPQECRVTAEYAISHGIGEFWKRRQGVFM